MVYFNRLECCGLWEATTNSVRTSVSSFLRQLYSEGFVDEYATFHGGGIVFTDIGKCTVARRLLTELDKLELGRTTTVPSFTNPNTENRVATHVWVPNQRRLRAYLKQAKIIPKTPPRDMYW